MRGVKTHVILDGLTDPRVARDLSAAWAAAGFDNQVDPAGQCATIAVDDEAAMDRAAAIARTFGLEVRDRAGNTFAVDNDLTALRQRVTHEYKSRFATAIVFGLPALLLHYLSPVLVGADVTPRGMLYSWLIQLLLVGWLIIAAGWPMLWQAALSVRGLRASADVLTVAAALLAFLPSCVAWVGVVVSDEPWLSQAYFHAAVYVMLLATLQRWLSHRAAAGMSGRATLMILATGRLLGTWLIVIVAATLVGGWQWGIAMGLLMPPLVSLGAINPWSPGPSAALPVFAFAGALVFGGATMVVEIAAGFQLMMVLVFAFGWRATSRNGS